MSVRKLSLICLVLLFARSAHAGVATAPQPRDGYDSVISAGVSAGVIDGRDADFWGWSLGYGHLFSDPWGIDVALLWDRETEKKTSDLKKVVDTYTLSSTVSYRFNERFSLAGGAGIGIASDDNPLGSMEFEKGDVSVGLIGTFSFPRLRLRQRDNISVSFSAEYNVSQKEPSVSVDLVFGWSL